MNLIRSVMFCGFGERLWWTANFIADSQIIFMQLVSQHRLPHPIYQFLLKVVL
jgi:hypothetical protein